MDAPTIEMIAMASPFIAVGAAWGSAKAAMNGTKSRVTKLEEEADNHADRLARIETKIDFIVENIK